MTLQPGLLLVNAPHFPPVTDWADRLALSSGVRITGEYAFPREPWREPDAADLTALVRDPTLPLFQIDLDAALAVWSLPQRLLTAWWQLLEASAGGDLAGFDGYLRQVSEFLTFKGLLPAGGIRAEVVVVPPDRPSLRVDPEGGSAGLGWTSDLWGLVHLGDGPAHIVYVNRRIDLDVEADYPVVRLRLDPGQGVRLPRASLLLDAPAGDEVPAVWLLLRTETTT